jgi:hypothetical protein
MEYKVSFPSKSWHAFKSTDQDSNHFAALLYPYETPPVPTYIFVLKDIRKDTLKKLPPITPEEPTHPVVYYVATTRTASCRLKSASNNEISDDFWPAASRRDILRTFGNTEHI